MIYKFVGKCFAGIEYFEKNILLKRKHGPLISMKELLWMGIVIFPLISMKELL